MVSCCHLLSLSLRTLRHSGTWPASCEPPDVPVTASRLLCHSWRCCRVRACVGETPRAVLQRCCLVFQMSAQHGALAPASPVLPSAPACPLRCLWHCGPRTPPRPVLPTQSPGRFLAGGPPLSWPGAPRLQAPWLHPWFETRGLGARCS